MCVRVHACMFVCMFLLVGWVDLEWVCDCGISYSYSFVFKHFKSKLVLTTVLPSKSDSDIMFCLQCYQGLIIHRSLVY